MSKAWRKWNRVYYWTRQGAYNTDRIACYYILAGCAASPPWVTRSPKPTSQPPYRIHSLGYTESSATSQPQYRWHTQWYQWFSAFGLSFSGQERNWNILLQNQEAARWFNVWMWRRNKNFLKQLMNNAPHSSWLVRYLRISARQTYFY